jgi:hypothetical protein
VTTPPACRWTEDEDGVYDTDCGNKFMFTDDGPVANKMRFCGYCGKPLKEVKFDARRIAGVDPGSSSRSSNRSCGS